MYRGGGGGLKKRRKYDKKKKEEEVPVALFSPLGRWTGNNFLFKGGLMSFSQWSDILLIQELRVSILVSLISYCHFYTTYTHICPTRGK